MYTYEEAVEYIEEIPKFTTKNKLEHTKECLERLGTPQNGSRIIHVAGTNGKGSVCAFLSSMLGEGGYQVGLFTSPHLVKINERFQINEVPIDNETFLKAFLKVEELSKKLVEEGNYHPTYFEFLFLMSMLIFQAEQVDYIVLETGLGGRLDATNSIAEPLACVITSISLDHTEYLGDTVAAIAGEKAGIIKPGIPVICDGNSFEATHVIREKAKEQGSSYYEVGEALCKIIKNTADGIDFSFQSAYYGTVELQIPFVAKYQVMNAALAMEVMGVLKKEHKIPFEVLKKGIQDTKWQGRMETIAPGIIVDGAHNEDGIAKFVETARYFQDNYPITLLFTAVADKDYQDMIRIICKELRLCQVITTEIAGNRRESAKELGRIFQENGCEHVLVKEKVEEAFEAACDLRGEGLLFCVGSLYLVGEIKDYIRRKSHD